MYLVAELYLKKKKTSAVPCRFRHHIFLHTKIQHPNQNYWHIGYSRP